MVPESQVSGVIGNYKYIDKKDQLVMRQRENGKMQTLIDYESGQVYNTDGTLMETNEEIKEE